MSDPYDLLIIGGGINGCGIARDAAGRGLSVMLAEQGDLAGATSAASSKLIHGGLRYLEQYEIRLVREALAEREVLLRSAPHIIWPLRFVLPHDATLRPLWLIRLGLFLYDHLAGRRTLQGSEGLDLAAHAYGAPLRRGIARGFAYSDCWVDDSRLVVLNAVAAAQRGAAIRPRTRVAAARRDGAHWLVSLAAADGSVREVAARALVNAAGPWVGEVLASIAAPGGREVLEPRLVKGSHIVVPRLYDGPQAYILQNTDRRIVFVIPYEGRFTLIGTTDVPFEGEPGAVTISPEETDYLCAAVSRWLARPVVPADVVWSYAGIRPLYDDRAASASTVTRDYVLELDREGDGPPLLSVFGGKITTFRRLAEQALDKLAPVFPDLWPAWTGKARLPGGDLDDFAGFVARVRAARPWLEPAMAERLAHAYGTRIERVLGDARKMADLGDRFGGDLTEREVAYLVREEWAGSAEDVLWRRSKLGLHLDAEGQARLKERLG